MDPNILPPLPDRPLEMLNPAKIPVRILMALAVVERGEPMTYEEIAARLGEIGATRSPASLKKAWHGRKPLRKTLDGRLDVDRTCREWEFLTLEVRVHLGLGWGKKPPGESRLAAPPPELTPGFTQVLAKISRYTHDT